ncbi:MAG: SCP2 sterol-binding domain-containing protein [Promethearchaeota archaeon]
MVDEALLKELKAKLDAGSDSANPDDVLKVYEFFKQVAQENEDLKEELEDMDIAVQTVITDVDKKYWITAKDGEINYGPGEIDNPSFTFAATLAVGAGMLYGEVDATSAYMAGDITVEGNLQDAMAFQEIIELAMEAFEDLTEDL